MVLAMAPAGRAAVYRLNPFSTNAPSMPDGLSWTNAFTSVTNAVAGLATGDELWLAAGVYPLVDGGNFQLPAGASLYGGFVGTETSREARNPATNVTILDGQGGGFSLVTVAPGQGVSVVDGLVLQNAAGGLGAGISASGAELVITGNQFLHLGTNTGLGGAIYVAGAPATVTSNLFQHCVANQGAGIAAVQVPVHFAANQFRNNSGRAGSALFAHACLGVVDGNTFFQNSASPGGTVDADLSSLDFLRNQFLSNRAGSGGSAGIAATGEGILLARDNVFALGAIVSAAPGDGASGSALHADAGMVALIWNNTFLDNDSRVYGLPVVAAPGGAEVVNNLFVREEWAINAPINSPGDFRNNCFFRCPYPWPSSTPLEGQNGNFSADPQLAASPPLFQPRLSPGSPCRNAGENGLLAGGLDLDGNARAADGQVDIGAFEAGDAAPAPPVPRRFYVAPGGAATNSGLSWSGAFGSISNATAQADPAFDTEVWVQAGLWKETIHALPFLRIYGGFAGSETNFSERNPALAATVIDGRNITNGVLFDTTGPFSLLDGFTITRGAAASGGGIYGYASSPIVANNILTGNAANTRDLSVLGFGGGAAFEFGAPILSNNVISRNVAKGGGGLFISTLATQGALVINNVIQSNSVDPSLSLQPQLGGAGLFVVGSARVDNNLIADNLVTLGPRGVNAPLSGAGAFVSAVGPCAVRNNNLLRNSFRNVTALSYPGGGLHADGPGLTIVNNLIAANTSGLDLLGANRPLVRGNLLFNNHFGNFAQAEYSAVSLIADPLLGPDSLTPSAHSPCIDAGYGPAVDLTETDFKGGLRWVGAAPDIGAVETVPAAFRSDAFGRLLLGAAFTFNTAGGITYAAYDLGCLPCGAATNPVVRTLPDGAYAADFAYTPPPPGFVCPERCLPGRNAAVFGAAAPGGHAFQVMENGVALFRIPFSAQPAGAPLLSLAGGPSGPRLLAVNAPGLAYVVESSANLRDWAPVATLSPDAPGPFTLALPASGAPVQFYRARTPP